MTLSSGWDSTSSGRNAAVFFRKTARQKDVKQKSTHQMVVTWRHDGMSLAKIAMRDHEALIFVWNTYETTLIQK